MTKTAGYLAVKRRINTDASPQSTTEISTTTTPMLSPWVPAPVVMIAAPANASARQTSVMGVIFSLSTIAARMVTDTGVRALMSAAMEAPVIEIPVWMQKIVAK